jgi:hypothetical protein
MDKADVMNSRWWSQSYQIHEDRRRQEGHIQRRYIAKFGDRVEMDVKLTPRRHTFPHPVVRDAHNL